MQTDKQSHDAASAQMGQIMDEYLERANRGERPNIEEYAERYPDLADVIRKMLPALQVMQTSDALDETGEQRISAEIRPEGPLGDFRIVRELGRGGMGVVYEATQISLGRTVALKVLPFAAAMDERQLQRFKNEAQAAASLHHPHIVPVFGVGCERGVHYYAMQLIEGQTLATVIGELSKLGAQASLSSSAPSDHDSGLADQAQVSTKAAAALSTAHSSNTREYFRSAARLARQAATALEHAHQAGVIHRDVKPANLILDPRGEVWITDFGLAQVQSDARLTMTGDLMGTLRYMSPEQALAKRVTVDHRTDIYSLGATLYELLTVQPAFSGADREELLRQIAFEESKPARRINHAIPVELETIVMKAMAKNPAERYATAEELAEDLQRFLDDRPITARRPTLAQHVSRWTRRHRGVAATMAAAMMFAIIGLGISTAVIAAKEKETQKALNETTKVVTRLQEETREKERLLAAETAAKQAETRAKESMAELVRLEKAARHREQMAIQRERRKSYDHEIMLANLSQQEGNDARAISVLQATRPEFRDWEWNYLTRRAFDVRFSFDIATPPKVPSRARRVHLSPQGHHLAIPVLADASAIGSFNYYGVPKKIGLAFVSAETGKLTYLASPDDSRRVSLISQSRERGDITCAFAPNSRRAALAVLGKKISVVDLSQQRELFSLDDHTEDVTCLSFSSDGKWLASGSQDKTVRIWDMETQECVRVYDGHADGIRHLAFCPNGTNRIVSQSGKSIQNASPNKAFLGIGIGRFDSEKQGFRVRVVHDGTPAYDAGIQAGDFITMVDEQAAEQIPNFVDNLSLYSPGDAVKFKIRRGDDVVALEATLTKLPGWVSKSQGKELAVLRSRRSHAIHVWDPTSGELAFPEINGEFRSWSPDGEYLALTKWHDRGQATVIMDMDGGAVLEEQDLDFANFRPDSERVLLTGRWKGGKYLGALQEWDLEAVDKIREFPALKHPRFAAYALGGSHLLVAKWGSTQIDVVDADTGAIVGGKSVSKAYEREAFLVEENGRYFTLQQPKGKVSMWDVQSWITQHDSRELPGDYKATNAAVGPHGKLLAITNTTTNSVDVLDLHSLALVHRLRVDFPLNQSMPERLLFDAGSKQIAIVGQADPVRFHVQAWDLATQKTILIQRALPGNLTSAAFYGQELRAVVNDRGRWQVVDVAKNEFIWELPAGSFSFGRRKVCQDAQLIEGGAKVMVAYSPGGFELFAVEKDASGTTIGDLGLVRFSNSSRHWVSPQGNYLLVLENRGSAMTIYDVRKNERRLVDQLGAVNIATIRWSSNEQRLLLAGSKTRLIDVTTGRELLALPNRQIPTRGFFSSANQILIVTDKGRVNIFNGSNLAGSDTNHAELLADLAWDIVLDANAAKDELLRAVILAERARDRSAGIAKYDHILAAAHYRVGNYHAAAEKLSSIRRRPNLRRMGASLGMTELMLRRLHVNDPYQWFQAMAQWKLGDTELAKQIFAGTYVSTVEDDRLRALARECANLLGSSLEQKLQEEEELRSQIAKRGPAVTSEERAIILLELRDRNGNGAISEEEMEEPMRPHFAEYDADSSGEIDRDELIERFKMADARMEAEGFLSQFDLNNDGALAHDEVPTFWQLQFDSYDNNKDGSLQLEEIEQVQRGKRNLAGPRGGNMLAVEAWATAMLTNHDRHEDDFLTEDEVPEVVWDRVRTSDTDTDGKLNLEELIKALGEYSGQRDFSPEDLLLSVDRFYLHQDKNGDKVVTEDECNAVPWSLFSPHDTNDDGRLEYDEVFKSLEAEVAMRRDAN